MDWITLLAVVGIVALGIVVWRLLGRWLSPRKPTTREEARALAELEVDVARARSTTEAARLGGFQRR